MTLYDLIRAESEEGHYKILSAAILSAIANTCVLAIVGAGPEIAGRLRIGLWVLFLLVTALYVVSYSYCVKSLTAVMEAALYRVRVRLGEKLRRVEILALDQIGAGIIYDRITQQTTAISNSSWLIALGLQALTFLVCVLIYIAYLSLPSFFMMFVLAAIAVPFYRRRNQKVMERLQAAGTKRVALFKVLNDLLRGFKEVRFRAARSAALNEDFKAIAAEVKDRTIEAHILDQENGNFILLNMYVLLAATVFVMPEFVTISTEGVRGLTSAVLFLAAPISILSFTIPEYERAELAATGIQALEGQLERAISTELLTVEPRKSFSQIDAIDLCFEYKDADGGQSFSIGPVSLSIKAGEIIFFVGGNGSGKTTLLKVLSGLYAPSSGSLLVDGVAVGPHNLQSYRELVSAIFTDFHLFQQLYGIADKGPAQVVQLLDKMQMSKKTGYTEEGFTRLNLSTGQKKRVAMVVALLEERPIYIFDEWAADQDPEFRHYYYQELLPELKRQGKTVLAISHDDRYFGCADRVVTMELGAIRSISAHQPPA